MRPGWLPTNQHSHLRARQVQRALPNAVPLRVGQHIGKGQLALTRWPGDAGDEFSADQRETPSKEFAGEGNLCEVGGDGQLQRHRIDAFAGGLADVTRRTRIVDEHRLGHAQNVRLGATA